MAPGSAATTAPVTITDPSFDQFVKGNRVAVLDFWAAWCGPCKRLDPILAELSSELAGKVVFGKVNADENQQTVRKYGIMSLPTLLLFRDGAVVDQIVGVIPKQDLLARLRKHMA